MKRSILVYLLIFACLSVSAVGSAAKENWTKLETNNFTVVGNAGDGAIRKVAKNLETFRQAVGLILPTAAFDSPLPTTVIVFKSHDSFHPYMPMYRGTIRDNIAGFFVPRPDSNLIAMHNDSQRANPFEVIYHEYTHFIVNRNLRRIPVWLNEGLAEFYSTFDTGDNDTKLNLGKPVVRHISTLRNNQLIPFSRLFAVDSRSPEYNESGKVGIFYAESWALVHYLMIGDNQKRQGQLSKFIAQLSTNLTVEENFRQSFGTDYKGMENELRSYVNLFSFPFFSFKLKQQLETGLDAEPTPLSEAATEFYLADLLLAGNRLADADTHLAKSLAADPRFAPSKFALAEVAMRERRRDDGEKLMAEAITLDPGYAPAQYAYGNMLYAGKKYDVAAERFKKVVELQPSNPYGYSQLGFVYLDSGRVKEAPPLFKRAAELDPNSTLYRTTSLAYFRHHLWQLAGTDAVSYIGRFGWRDHHSAYAAILAYFALRENHQSQDADALLNKAAEKSEPEPWTLAIIDYLRNKLPEQELLARATDAGKLTEAHCYIGLQAQLAGKQDVALAHFRTVVAGGSRTFDEYKIAQSELSRLGRKVEIKD